MRSRAIKPGFWDNELLAECDPFARLLFIGLWNLADRAGRLEERIPRIKKHILGYDDVDIEALLTQLADRGFIRRYQADGARFIQVVDWLEDQDPNYREPASPLPAPEGYVDSLVVTFGVPKDQRDRILERDGHRCVTCGSTDRLSMDHIVPRSKGGSGEDENLQTLCRSCNSRKGNR